MVRFQILRWNITLHFTRSCSEAVMWSSWVNPPSQPYICLWMPRGIQGAAPHQSGSTAGLGDWIEAKGQDLGGPGETRPKTAWVKNNIMNSPIVVIPEVRRGYETVSERTLFPLAVFGKSRTPLLESHFLESEAVQALKPCRERTMVRASLVLDAWQAASDTFTQPLELKRVSSAYKRSSRAQIHRINGIKKIAVFISDK